MAKFPIQMSGVEVYDIEGLKKHFELNALLENRHRLSAWLKGADEEELAQKVKALSHDLSTGGWLDAVAPILGIEAELAHARELIAEKQREEEARKQREAEARRLREAEARRLREEKARRQREEEARKQREEEARKQREEEARKQREEETKLKKALKIGAVATGLVLGGPIVAGIVGGALALKALDKKGKTKEE